MKKKKGAWIFASIIIIIFTAGFLIVSYWAETGYGKLNTRFAIMLKFDKYFNSHSVKDMPISEIREYTNNVFSRWGSKAIPFNNIKNVNISTSGGQIPVRIYTPDDNNIHPLIIYSHGGGWVGGNLDTHDNVCRKISKGTNAVVVSVNYRLAPENPFPAGLNDVYNTLQWVYKNAESIHGDAKHIAVAGDSAGGNLSAVVSQMARDKGGPPITCQVLIYPSTNIFELNSKSWSYFADNLNLNKNDMEKYIDLYVPKKEDRKNPYASPLLADNFNKLPDALIITAEFDALRDEGEAYGDKLKKSGVDVVITRYKGVTHGFINMDNISNQADAALNQISQYLQNEFKK